MIDEVIASVLAKARPSSGGDLDGIVIDADYAFENESTFEEVEIARTTQPECMLEITARAPERMTMLQHISHALREAWQSLAYSDFQATSILWYRQAMIMKFVTSNIEGTLCVTGRVIITAPRYSEMVLAFERDFGFAGPLHDLPEGS